MIAVEAKISTADELMAKVLSWSRSVSDYPTGLLEIVHPARTRFIPKFRRVKVR